MWIATPRCSPMTIWSCSVSFIMTSPPIMPTSCHIELSLIYGEWFSIKRSSNTRAVQYNTLYSSVNEYFSGWVYWRSTNSRATTSINITTLVMFLTHALWITKYLLSILDINFSERWYYSSEGMLLTHALINWDIIFCTILKFEHNI